MILVTYKVLGCVADIVHVSSEPSHDEEADNGIALRRHGRNQGGITPARRASSSARTG
jgi:hypothetical protein